METNKSLATSDGIAEALLSLSGKDLAQLPHSLLYNARYKVPSEQQNMISPYEHRAFAREAVTENPMMALPIAASVVPYQLYKLIDGKSRSTPSIDQVLQGFMGVGEGLMGALRK